MHPSTYSDTPAPGDVNGSTSTAKRTLLLAKRIIHAAAKALRAVREAVRFIVMAVRAIIYALVLFLILAGIYILFSRPAPRPAHFRSFTSIRDTSVPAPSYRLHRFRSAVQTAHGPGAGSPKATR